VSGHEPTSSRVRSGAGSHESISLAVLIFRSDRNCLLLLLLLGVLLFATGLGARDLWAPDEPDIGEVVREIHLTGSWAVLRDNQELYFEKPPLYPWLAALASLPAGKPTEFALRLPASLSALLGLFVVFYLGRGLFGRRVGALAAVVLATTYGYFMEARWAHPDMLWTLWFLLSCLAFHKAYRAGGDARWMAVFYLAIGLANLTKGPHGILIPLLAIFVFLASSRDLAFVKRMGLAWGLPLALVPVGLWVAAYRSTGEPFPLEALLLRLTHRFTRGEHHAHPFYHVFISLAAEFVPWVILLPAALWQTFPRRGARPDRDNAYVYSWILVIFTVFAVSVEKRSVYLLPLLPLLALLVARLWDVALLGWEPSPADRPIVWLLGTSLALAVGGAVVVLPKIRARAPDLFGPAALLASVACLAILVALIVYRRHRGGAALAAFSAGLVVTYLVVAVAVLPPLDPYKSARVFCHRILEVVGDRPLAMYPDYRPTYVYYTGRFIPVLHTREELREYFASGKRSFCLIQDDNFEAERRTLGLQLEVVDRQQVGHRTMLLVAGGTDAPVERTGTGEKPS
jgi:4-amino-4-deoxy-L-arabinose transferase-like glycosyltransferase